MPKKITVLMLGLVCMVPLLSLVLHAAENEAAL